MGTEDKSEPVTAGQVINWSLTIFAAICVPVVGLLIKDGDQKTHTDIATIAEGQRISTINQDRWDQGTNTAIANEVHEREAIAVEIGRTQAALNATNEALKRTDEMSERRHRDRSDQFNELDHKLEVLEARLIDLEIVIRGTAPHK